MTSALPVLVDCPPYRARLTRDVCALRWRKSNDPALAKLREASRDACFRCEIGKGRSAEAGETKTTPSLKHQQARTAAHAFRERLTEENEMPVCSKCMAKKTRLLKSGLCRKCGGVGSPAPTMADVNRAETPLEGLARRVEAVKRAETALGEARLDLKLFAQENAAEIDELRAILDGAAT